MVRGGLVTGGAAVGGGSEVRDVVGAEIVVVGPAVVVVGVGSTTVVATEVPGSACTSSSATATAPEVANAIITTAPAAANR